MASPCSRVSDRGAREIAAEGVDRHRIGAVQPAHEIGDGVLGVDEAAVHEVAGVEEDEDVGADEGVGPVHARQGILLGLDQGMRRAVFRHRKGRVGALGEGGDLLQNAVLVDPEIGRLQTVDVVVLAVGHLKAQHHHVDLDPEDGPLAVLGAQQRAAAAAMPRNPRREIIMIVYRYWNLLQSRLLFRCLAARAVRADLVTHQRAAISAERASPPGARRKSAPPVSASIPESAR